MGKSCLKKYFPLPCLITARYSFQLIFPLLVWDACEVCKLGPDIWPRVGVGAGWAKDFCVGLSQAHWQVLCLQLPGMKYILGRGPFHFFAQILKGRNGRKKWNSTASDATADSINDWVWGFTSTSVVWQHDDISLMVRPNEVNPCMLLRLCIWIVWPRAQRVGVASLLVLEIDQAEKPWLFDFQVHKRAKFRPLFGWTSLRSARMQSIWIHWRSTVCLQLQLWLGWERGGVSHFPTGYKSDIVGRKML